VVELEGPLCGKSLSKHLMMSSSVSFSVEKRMSYSTFLFFNPAKQWL
jgi:hypothetical protein